MRNLILASQSPRRKELLEKCGYPFSITVADIDETIDFSLSLEDAIQTLAYKKAEKVFTDHKEDVVIGSDTIVTINSQILGKPKDKNDAFNMLKSLSGKTHQVITGLAVITKDKVYKTVSVNDVTFYDLSDEEIYKYIETNEPMDKAGAYAIQGIASRYIKSINGDYYAIMGLPVSKLYHILKYIYNY
mgnify:FL=1